jgi:TP901-1 family phage major tail protein
MAEAVQGAKIIYLYRLLEEQATEDAFRLAFVTEDSISYSKDADSTTTKDGAIRTPSAVEIEKTMTSILTKGDEDIAKLKNAMLNDKLIELWEVNLDEPVTGQDNKFKGTYFQGYITEYEKSSNAEDMVEISMTVGVNGKGADGNVTVSTEQQDDASYVFTDTPAQ